MCQKGIQPIARGANTDVQIVVEVHEWASDWKHVFFYCDTYVICKTIVITRRGEERKEEHAQANDVLQVE